MKAYKKLPLLGFIFPLWMMGQNAEIENHETNLGPTLPIIQIELNSQDNIDPASLDTTQDIWESRAKANHTIHPPSPASSEPPKDENTEAPKSNLTNDPS